ncbi:ABC transporter ATP-binding protein [Pseudolabrys taiwanensis]|uniref:ABC transporter ATP-binding protein n=1 Tax=Pseudolabrys taiwanensis TaxID=331696 RepID=A0A345ZTQ8_9HYPH|nr:ABC transporter ATP-binding protein [Pseudolabrys taiwanensis]AXK80305.1 ABC transporter ATP-binding protein [Pseudolabrys taiwanensis]
MTAPLLDVQGLSKRFGGLTATDSVDLTLPEGELHALIGPNGAGKTTLISQLVGALPHDSGSIKLAGEEIGQLPVWKRVHRGLGRTFQITQLLPDFTALDTVMLAVQSRHGHSFRFFADARRNRAIRTEAAQYLDQVGLAPRAQARVGDLAQGERKQLELAAALAGKPRLLLLDEPMAGLGTAESQQMIGQLAALKGKITMLIVEHDMEAVFTLADRVSVLVYGKVIAQGDVEAIKNNEDVRTAYLGEGDV